jgi:hypothetical protein
MASQLTFRRSEVRSVGAGSSQTATLSNADASDARTAFRFAASSLEPASSSSSCRRTEA